MCIIYSFQEPAYYGQVRGILQWIQRYVDPKNMCFLSIETNSSSDIKNVIVNLRQGASKESSDDKRSSSNQGASESKFIYISIICCVPTLITIVIFWRNSLFYLFNIN